MNTHMMFNDESQEFINTTVIFDLVLLLIMT